MICILHNYYLGDQIEKNEIGGTCGTYGRQERFIQGFGWETRVKETGWVGEPEDWRPLR